MLLDLWNPYTPNLSETLEGEPAKAHHQVSVTPAIDYSTVRSRFAYFALCVCRPKMQAPGIAAFDQLILNFSYKF